tara:strand:+ start:1173 stop:1439 length:267 start_codon:yes stop_codon:yes gene_type:complete
VSWEKILKISTEEAIQDAKRYGDKEDIDSLTPAEKTELRNLISDAEDIRMYYGDIWLLGIGDLYEEIKTTVSIERAREIMSEIREKLK